MRVMFTADICKNGNGKATAGCARGREIKEYKHEIMP